METKETLLLTRIAQLAFLLICLSSCDMFYPKVYHVDPELQPFVDKFIEEGEVRGKFLIIDNIEAYFDESIPTPAGVRTRHETIVLRVNPNDWKKYDDNEREAVMFHELVHKVLNRRHAPDSAFSIMVEHPELMNYIFFRERLLDELFK